MKMSYRKHTLAYPNHSLKTCGGPKDLTSITIFKRCSEKSSSGRQEHCILKTHFELLRALFSVIQEKKIIEFIVMRVEPLVTSSNRLLSAKTTVNGQQRERTSLPYSGSRGRQTRLLHVGLAAQPG